MTQTRIRGYCIVGLLQAATGGITGLYPLYWHSELHFSAEQVGLINAWSGTLSIVAPVAIGAFSGLFSSVNLLIWCGVVQTICLALSLLIPSFIGQVACHCGFQFSRWGLITLLPVVVIQAMRGMPTSTFTRFQRAGNIGFLVSLIGLGNLSSYTGVYSVLLCAVVSAALSMAPFFDKLPTGNSTSSSPEPGQLQAPTPYSTLLQERNLICLAGTMFFVSTLNPMLFVFLPLRMSEMGANSGAFSNVIALCGAFALMGLPVLGRLIDRISYSTVFAVVPILASLRIALLGLPNESYWWFGVQQLLHLPTSIALELALIKAISETFATVNLPRVQGLVNACALSGMAFGSFIAAKALPMLGGDLQNLFFLFASLPLFAYPFILMEWSKAIESHPTEPLSG